jgi:hypothetical protein
VLRFTQVGHDMPPVQLVVIIACKTYRDADYSAN